MIEALINSIDNVLYGIGIGIVLGTLFTINRRLLMLLSSLQDIKRLLQEKKDKGY